MNIIGEKTRIRDRRPSDSGMELIWSLDAEVSRLDPSVGEIFNNELFSIETLDGQHIGVCCLYNQTATDVQLGIRIGNRNYWDKGHGTEAVNILVNYCFMTMSVERIWLKVLPDNIRAIKCYERCGFVQSGKLALGGYEFIMMEKRT